MDVEKRRKAPDLGRARGKLPGWLYLSAVSLLAGLSAHVAGADWTTAAIVALSTFAGVGTGAAGLKRWRGGK